VAAELGTDYSFLCVSHRGPKDYLHDQHGRSTQPVFPQDHQESWGISERRGRHQTSVFGDEKRRRELEVGPGLESCLEPVHAVVGGSHPRGGALLVRATHVRKLARSDRSDLGRSSRPTFTNKEKRTKKERKPVETAAGCGNQQRWPSATSS